MIKNISLIIATALTVIIWLAAAFSDIGEPVRKAAVDKNKMAFASPKIIQDSAEYNGVFLELEPVKKKLSMLFFGDLMLDRHVAERIDGNIDYLIQGLAASGTDWWSGYDLVGANLEGAVTNSGAHYKPDNLYDFAFDPGLVEQLKKYNFNFFTIANNHLADQGERGIIETGENLDKLGFFYVGCNDRVADSCSTKILDIGGQMIGMAGYSQVYGLLDKEKIVEQIIALKASSSKVVVNIHWGKEYEHYFDGIQGSLAHAMIDAGADMVIGHHPHVVQGMEIYNSKPIFYSLGNFVFDQYFSPDTQEGLAVGIVSIEDETSLYLFPFKSKSSQVSLLAGEEKQDFYQKYIGWSKVDSGTERMIREGKIELLD